MYCVTRERKRDTMYCVTRERERDTMYCITRERERDTMYCVTRERERVSLIELATSDNGSETRHPTCPHFFEPLLPHDNTT